MNMSLSKVGIIKKKGLSKADELGEELSAWFGKRAVRTEFDLISPDMNLLVILGGDGTLLHVAEQAGRYEIPVVGINLGSLGFLTEVAIDERYQILEALLDGVPLIEDRMMLKSRIRHRQGVSEWRFALNEIIVSRGTLERLIRLCTWADDTYITTYKADGLIFSTPTGSTAYNLSAGGPIVQPGLRSILLTPICPFMLESRPILLPQERRVTTRIAESAEDVQVIIDGQPAWTMRSEDTLEVVTAEKSLRLVCSSTKGYFDILRSKLNWGGQGEPQESVRKK